MKILLINKFFFPRGGADRHFFALKKLLEENGHEVVVFSMDHPDNTRSTFSGFFVSNVDFERVRFDWQGVRAVGRMLYSFEARRKLRKLIERERPDVAHLHNIYHQLSPSILSVLTAYRIPVVQTLHDFKLISPNYNLYAHGGICRHALGGRWYECILHRCVKRSFAASFVEAIEMWFHRTLGLYERAVDRFIAPSQFLLDLVQRSAPSIASKLRLLPNFIELDDAQPPLADDALVYVGRLSEEKGVEDLVTAAAELPFPLHIVGSGPLEQRLRERVRSEGLARVTLLGRLDGDVLRETVQRARAVIVPSRCYENCPLVILEAYRASKPVIGTRHGGITELVRDGETGLLAMPNSIDDLKRCLKIMVDDPQHAREMGGNGRRFVERFSSQHFYRKLMTIYEEVLARHRT